MAGRLRVTCQSTEGGMLWSGVVEKGGGTSLSTDHSVTGISHTVSVRDWSLIMGKRGRIQGSLLFV